MRLLIRYSTDNDGSVWYMTTGKPDDIAAYLLECKVQQEKFLEDPESAEMPVPSKFDVEETEIDTDAIFWSETEALIYLNYDLEVNEQTAFKDPRNDIWLDDNELANWLKEKEVM